MSYYTPKILRDGSLLFASFPATAQPDVLARHLSRMAGVAPADGRMSASDSWIAYALDGRDFEVREQFGDYWFVAWDPGTPRDTLRAIVSHAEQLLQDDPTVARQRDQRVAWSAAIAGLTTFAVASLLGQSPLVRIIAFAIGAVAGSLVGEAPKRIELAEQVPES